MECRRRAEPRSLPGRKQRGRIRSPGVFLHSLAAVIRAAGQMRVGGLGILGAVGVRRDGRIAGRIRDRAVLLGVAVQQAADVNSVDELLFMVPRPWCSAIR